MAQKPLPLAKNLGFPRSLLGNLFLFCISLIFSLAAAEWAVRTWLPSPDYGVGKRPALRNGLFMYDAELGWKGTPNAQSPYISKDFIVHVTHDEHGFRNQTQNFIPNKRNILLLGDSYGWGWGVKDNETAASVFNQQNPNANIYNLSVPGYGTDQELLTLQRFSKQHPDNFYDDVVLLLYYNDFEDNIATERYSYPKPMFQQDKDNQLQLTNVPVPYAIPEAVSITEPPPAQTWLQKSQLLNFMLDKLARIIFAPSHTNTNLIPEKPTETEEYSVEITKKLLQAIQTFCQDRKIRFHVVFLMTINTDEKPAALINALATQLDKEKISHSFYYSKNFPRTDLWLDTHYTPYGQKLLAEHISSAIKLD